MKFEQDGKRLLQDLERWYKNYDNNNTLAILLRAEKWLTLTNTTANKNI
jgi:predicted metal-dependent hydrolase